MQRCHLKKHLSISQLTLGCGSGWLGRASSRAASEIRSIIGQPAGMPVKGACTRRSEKRGLAIGDNIEEVACLSERSSAELKDMVASVSAHTETVIRGDIRGKRDALKWLVDHWAVAKGVVRLWLEQDAEIRREKEEYRERLETLRRINDDRIERTHVMMEREWK